MKNEWYKVYDSSVPRMRRYKKLPVRRPSETVKENTPKLPLNKHRLKACDEDAEF